MYYTLAVSYSHKRPYTGCTRLSPVLQNPFVQLTVYCVFDETLNMSYEVSSAHADKSALKVTNVRCDETRDISYKVSYAHAGKFPWKFGL